MHTLFSWRSLNRMSDERDILPTEVPERLLVADWDDVLPRVQLWANHFHKRYLRQIRAAPTAEDLVQEAIVKLYSGRRKLPDHVPLLTVIINNIQSDIWNYLTKEGYTHKKTVKGKEERAGADILGWKNGCIMLTGTLFLRALNSMAYMMPFSRKSITIKN